MVDAHMDNGEIIYRSFIASTWVSFCPRPQSVSHVSKYFVQNVKIFNYVYSKYLHSHFQNQF